MCELIIWFELPSKNFMWKFLRVSFSMGFSIMGDGTGVGSDALAISVFGGFVVV